MHVLRQKRELAYTKNMATTCTMILGDCLEVMPTLPKASMQMCFADFPYGIDKKGHTRQKWDKSFSFSEAMLALEPVLAFSSARIFTCGDRLAAALAHSYPKLFRYSLIWHRSRSSLYFHANKRPLSSHETIQVFGRNPLTYNPQMTQGPAYRYSQSTAHDSVTQHATIRVPTINTGTRFPKSVLCFAQDRPVRKGIHPTQKPISLLNWIIKTYSNLDDHIIDPVSGSGVTAVSAIQNGRNVTCIEKDEGYFNASVERVKKAIVDGNLDVKLEVRR